MGVNPAVFKTAALPIRTNPPYFGGRNIERIISIEQPIWDENLWKNMLTSAILIAVSNCADENSSFTDGNEQIIQGIIICRAGSIGIRIIYCQVDLGYKITVPVKDKQIPQGYIPVIPDVGFFRILNPGQDAPVDHILVIIIDIHGTVDAHEMNIIDSFGKQGQIELI